MVMVMNILIVFLLMFVESLIDQNKYPNLLKPYNLYIRTYACPNCEEWCANDPLYTCNYDCYENEASIDYGGNNDLGNICRFR
ncbi:unnamed protein product [Meloidogyne enterolobii]|uniref:Uncharacterized protein n=1 Tax=Meloidogyne enterolobii TaxID=390850 RepID=A0ACB1AFF1_MELEN